MQATSFRVLVDPDHVDELIMTLVDLDHHEDGDGLSIQLADENAPPPTGDEKGHPAYSLDLSQIVQVVVTVSGAFGGLFAMVKAIYDYYAKKLERDKAEPQAAKPQEPRLVFGDGESVKLSSFTSPEDLLSYLKGKLGRL